MVVIDPTYGSTYLSLWVPLNAIEIANREHFRNADDIIQDSVLVTRNTELGKDYFKYYENIFFINKRKFSFIETKFFSSFTENTNTVLAFIRFI